MILKVPFISQSQPKECAISCVAMIMEYYRMTFNQQKFIKNLTVDKYGYSLLDITLELLKAGYKIEFGFWDSDLIKKEFFDEFPIKPSELKQYAVKINLNRTFKNVLDDILAFSKKYPAAIKIEPMSLEKLDTFLKNNTPVIIHVDVSSYFDKTDDSIHSIIVIGKRNQKYIILDPLISKRTISSRKLFKAWRDGGGYYLVIKK